MNKPNPNEEALCDLAADSFTLGYDAGYAKAMERQQQFQQAVGEWSVATFPEATVQSICKHLMEEVYEVLGATPAMMPEECADIYLLLIGLCRRHGIDLEKEARMKFALVQLRRYAPCPERGYAKHVKE